MAYFDANDGMADEDIDDMADDGGEKKMNLVPLTPESAARIVEIARKHCTRQQWGKWLSVPLEHVAAGGDKELTEELVLAGANGDPIGAAIRGEQHDLVDHLLQEKPGRELCDSYLDLAVSLGNETIASLLLRHGADPQDQFDLAMSLGNEAIVSMLLRHGAAPDWEIYDGEINRDVCGKQSYGCGNESHVRPLHVAARKGHVGIVRVLLDAGASVHERIEIEEVLSDDEEAEELGDDEIRIMTESALDLAAMWGHVDVIKEITQREPSIVNRATAERTGYTALHYAAKHSQVGSIDALVEAGADLEARDKRGDTALHTAVEPRNCEATLLALLRHGTDKDVKNSQNMTPLHVSVAEGNMIAAKTLVSAGADVNLPLLLLSESPFSRKRERIRTFLGLGADVNTKRASDGNTPLHIAAEMCSSSVVDILLKAGGDEMAVNDQGLTPAGVVGRGLTLPHSFGDGVRAQLANAPRDRADRAWSRRGFFVLCRTFPSRVRLGLVPPENRDSEQRPPASAASYDPTAHRTSKRRTTAEGGGEEEQPEDAGTEGPTAFSVAMGRLMGLEADVIFRNIVEFL